MGVLAAATVACTGSIDEPVTDFSEVDRLAQSKENLLRAVVTEKELMITDLSVIESPAQTQFDSEHPSGYYLKGAWSFGRLIHNMLPAGSRDSKAAAAQFTNEWLSQWTTDQAPNAAVTTSLSRDTIRTVVLEPWREASGCAATDSACVLDMSKAPFRLLAIVYRPDLRKMPTASDPGFGGEGRFVFNMLDKTGKPIKGTVIFEYSLPIWSQLGVLTWAYRFHLLGSIPFSEGYNNVLALITNGFAGPGADPRRPNGNALNQLRTNELALKHTAGCAGGATFEIPLAAPCAAIPTEVLANRRQKLWELREFRINTAGKLAQHAMNQDPSRDFDVAARTDGSFNIGTGTRSNELAKFMYENQEAVAAGNHKIPKEWLANSTYIGSGVPAWGTVSSTVKEFVYNDGTTSHVIPENVRAGFALQTCGGCHRNEVAPTGAVATKTFLHVYDPRALDPAEANDRDAINASGGGRETGLSDFVVKEIQVGGPRYNDMTSLLENPFGVVGFKGHKVCAGDHDS
jgi:hypothetical protein